jgi:hypothetical protein
MDAFMLTPEMREQALAEEAEFQERRRELAAEVATDHMNLAQQVVDEERRLAAERKDIEQSVQDAKMQAAYAAVGFLQVLGREHKGAARAALLVEKGLAIKQIAIQTKVAAVKALATLGPIAGKVAAGAIIAWGAAQAAFVAAQAFTESSQVPSGGSGSIPGTGSNPLITSSASSSAAETIANDRRTVSQIIIQGPIYGFPDFERAVTRALQRSIGHDVMIINSYKNAQGSFFSKNRK